MAIVEHANCTTVTNVTPEHSFFSTLQLLDFNVFAAEKQYRIAFKPDMFRVPNKKGLEVVLHFLLTKLDPDRCKTEFAGCWPAHDAKRSHLFRKNVFNWLTELNRDHVEGIGIPRINSSTLTKASGPLVISLVERLSSLALMSQIPTSHHKERARVGPKFVPSKAHLNLAAAATLRMEHEVLRKQIAVRAGQTQCLRAKWNESARAISDEIQRMSREKKRLETKKDGLETIQKDCITAFSTDKKFIKTLSVADEEALRTNVHHKASMVKQHLRRFLEISKRRVPERAVVNSLINGSYGDSTIHHDKIALQVPSLVIAEYQKKMTEGSIGNTYRGGDLRLVALTKISHLALRLLSNSLNIEVSRGLVPTSALKARQTELIESGTMLKELHTCLQRLGQEVWGLRADMWLDPQPVTLQDVRLQSPMPVFSMEATHVQPSDYIHIYPDTPEPSARKRRSLALTPLSMRKYKRGQSRASTLSDNVNEGSDEVSDGEQDKDLDNHINQNLNGAFEKSRHSSGDSEEETFHRKDTLFPKEFNDLSLLDASTNNTSLLT